MKKIAVFGKPDSGKSTMSKQLALTTGIPLHPLVFNCVSEKWRPSDC